MESLLAHLDPSLPVAIGVTIHRAPIASPLAEVLGRRTKWTIAEARDGEPFVRGRVFVAPPDLHMLFNPDSIQLMRGPKEHHTRPAVDPMMASGARVFGARVIGVVLTGNLSDGVAGLIHVKRHGGISVVQDPAEAPYPSMPIQAIVHDHVDVVAKLESMPKLFSKLTGDPTKKRIMHRLRGK